MRLSLFLLIFSFSYPVFGQKGITKDQVAQVEPLLDLSFSEPERDSLISELEDYLKNYKAIHGQKIDNSIAPPLIFDPLSIFSGAAQTKHFEQHDLVKQRPIEWDLPTVEMPKNRADLAFYSVLELASLIKNRKTTSVELTNFFLERLRVYGDTLKCVISITAQIAFQEAQKADSDLAAGKYHGILHGIPYALKDLFAVKNTLTTWGAAPYKNQRIEADAVVYQKLKAAGAVLVAKVSLGSLAMGDLWHGGRTLNPWDLKQGSSGSSAGSAAATVAGLVPFAIGTETLGSIVSPSARCGATGLRPTFGRVNRGGAMTLCWSMDKIGPICRSVADAAAVFSVIQGGDTEGDAATKNLPFNYTSKADFSKLKIGYPKNIFDSLPKTRNEWLTLETLKKLGATLTPFEWTPKTPIADITMVNLMAECAAAFDDLTRSNLDDQLTGQRKSDWPNSFRGARFIPAVEYINANRLRTQLMLETDAILRGYHCVVFPNFEGNILQATNMTGHPTVVVPNGFNNGRPTTISFIGQLYDEASVLSIAKAFQTATDFHLKRPDKFVK
jgi:Asp-tRNA(Asn)/Glu-tRNA(Gln) amidotransferase A subunit family amidase